MREDRVHQVVHCGEDRGLKLCDPIWLHEKQHKLSPWQGPGALGLDVPEGVDKNFYRKVKIKMEL